MKLLVINGPNLNLLGLREPAIYGSQNYESLLALIRTACDAESIEVGFVQSNHEGAIVDAIQAAYGVYDGIVINPAAYTHTSVAILDALKAVALPAVAPDTHRASGRQLNTVVLAMDSISRSARYLAASGTMLNSSFTFSAPMAR